jgi:hypothetical protein
MNVLQMFCFDCNRQVGETRGDPSEAYHVNRLLEYLTQGSELGREAMGRKHQCIKERLLYLQYADRACVLDDFYYIVDRLWTTSWFLRLCDGKIGQGAITNDQLKDPETGRLNPLARPRGSFKGGFSIVTPALWDYLVETYGLIGEVYTSGNVERYHGFILN